MKPDDLEFDSEDEIDPEWLRIKTQQVCLFTYWDIQFILNYRQIVRVTNRTKKARKMMKSMVL